MDGHQFRGARIHRDMMLVSSVCRRALGCEWGGRKTRSRMRGTITEVSSKTGRVPGLRGAFIIASTPCSCVGVGETNIAVLLDCSKSSIDSGV